MNNNDGEASEIRAGFYHDYHQFFLVDLAHLSLKKYLMRL